MVSPRKQMPSFTLVLTSGHHSLLPTTVQFDSSASPTMLPTAPDYLMKTIDLRDHGLGDGCDEDSDVKTIFEVETPATRGADQTSNNSVEQSLLLLIRRFISYKRNFINNGPLVALKTSLN